MNLSSYQDYLDGGGIDGLQRRDVRRTDGKTKARCQCGSFAWPDMIVDVSGLPDHLTNGVTWACYHCLSTWERQKRPFDPADPELYRQEEWRIKFAEYTGSGAAEINDIKRAAIPYLEREKQVMQSNDLRVVAAELRAGRLYPDPEDVKRKHYTDSIAARQERIDAYNADLT